MSPSRNFLEVLRYAPDCTFSSRKMKSSLPSEGGGTPPSHTLPPLGRYAPSGLVASLSRKDCAPPNVLAHYATDASDNTHFSTRCPPMRWPTVRHWPREFSQSQLSSKPSTTPAPGEVTELHLPAAPPGSPAGNCCRKSPSNGCGITMDLLGPWYNL